MWPPKQLNAAPTESESRALMALIERQEGLVSSIETLRKETDAEHQRLSSKAAMLRDALQQMEYLNRLRTLIRSEGFNWLDQLSKAILDMEAKRDFLEPLFHGATTTLDGLSAVNDAFNLLKSRIETAFSQLPNFFATVAQESYGTDMLCAQTTDAIASFSSMATIAQRSIASKQNGVLHPLRRLPEEMLLQIFEHGAEEEAQEWFKYVGGVPPNPKFLTRIAGVCRRWRSIALSCPGLWRRVLAPAYTTRRVLAPAYTTRRVHGNASYAYRDQVIEKGIDHFRRALQLCGGSKIELTIPHRFITLPDVDMTTLEVRRINILDFNASPWPLVFPSPKHLWLGQAATNGALPMEIPLSILSNTSRITSSSVSLTFASPTSTVTHLVLCGHHATLPLNALLCSLPQLVLLDAKDAHLSNMPGTNIVQANIHSQLRTFGVDGTGLAFLAQAFVEGLRLPNLRHFEIANSDSENLAANYHSIPTDMSRHITHVGLFATCDVAGEALRAFIDIFPHLDTLSLHGTMTELAIQAFCRSSGLESSMPKTVQTIMICDYQEDGEAIYQRLHEIHTSSSSDESIKIIFQDCPNIRPDIRKGLS